jgi:hypothetical protein
VIFDLGLTAVNVKRKTEPEYCGFLECGAVTLLETRIYSIESRMIDE